MTNQRKPFVVRRVKASGVVAALPILEEFSAPRTPLDVLVVAAGFEDRVLQAPKCLVASGQRVSGPILIAKYATNESDNSRRLSELAPLLMQLAQTTVEFDAEDPSKTGQAIRSAISGIPGDRRAHVAFDISGASSTLILSTLVALSSLDRSLMVTIYYATAETYDAKPNSREELRLRPNNCREHGVSRVSHNELCAGLHHDHLPAMVIALPSMYMDRMESCLSHLNVGPMTGSSDNLFWILPSTEAEEHKWRQQEARKSVEILMHKYQGGEGDPPLGIVQEDQVKTCDVSSYQHCLELVVEQIDLHQGRNISVVHMGTKIQAIGVALAVAARQEVAVVTARPTEFNAQAYSSGVGTLQQLVFDDYRGAVAAVVDIGTIKVEV